VPACERVTGQKAANRIKPRESLQGGLCVRASKVGQAFSLTKPEDVRLESLTYLVASCAESGARNEYACHVSGLAHYGGKVSPTR
jgi:hypothetical protein